METFVTLLIPGVLALAAVRVMLLPLRGAVKLGIHAACGFLCLWILNTVSALTGIRFPVNAATVLVAGCLGLPGMGLMALLAVV